MRKRNVSAALKPIRARSAHKAFHGFDIPERSQATKEQNGHAMKYALALVFVVVQVAGEALRIPLLPLGVAQTVFFLVVLAVALASLSAPSAATFVLGSIDKSLLVFSLCLVWALVIGLHRGAEWRYVSEDSIPFLILLAGYVATRLIVRSTASMRAVINGILLGSSLAAFKLLFIAVVPVEVGWNGPWQAIREERFGLARVILNGADLFFVVSTVIASVLWLSTNDQGNWRKAAGLLSLGAAFVAGTRSNWVGLGLALLVTGVILGIYSPLRWRRVFLTGVMGVVLLVSVFRRSSTMSAATDEVLASQMSIALRLLESEGVVAQINRAVVVGNGMGSTYEYVVGSSTITTQWSHNAFLMLVMKTGVLGLVLFLAVVQRTFRQLLQSVRANHPWREELIGIVGAIVAVLVLSFGANKLFSFSGALFLGVAFGIVQAARVYGWPLEDSHH